MAFDGNGNWISDFSAVADRNADIKILASRFDNIFIADLAQSFENCLTKDGQIKPEGNFDADSNRVINVADPVADNDAVNLATLNDRIDQIEQDPILAYKWSDYIISDPSWLRADTFSWQDGTIYTNAYTHLYNDFQDTTSITETIGSYTITYYQAEDGHKIVMPDQETTVQNIYDESGVAWYYILDTTNQRFKLPRENPNREKLLGKLNVIPYSETDSVPYALYKRRDGGDSGRELPMQGGYYSSYSNGWVTVGATNASYTHPLAWGSKTGLGVDLESATGIYKGQKYLYFYVGQFIQSALQQTAGLNTELFARKVDLDAGNLSNAGKSLLSGFGMPSDNYESLTLGASGSTYTAPANGWFYFGKVSGAAKKYIELKTDNLGIQMHSVDTTDYMTIFIPVKKDDVVSVNYNATGNTLYLRFVYAEGEPNV